MRDDEFPAVLSDKLRLKHTAVLSAEQSRAYTQAARDQLQANRKATAEVELITLQLQLRQTVALETIAAALIKARS